MQNKKWRKYHLLIQNIFYFFKRLLNCSKFSMKGRLTVGKEQSLSGKAVGFEFHEEHILF
ncbi:MAG TPA: hypothetical protein DHV88_13190 [Roseburia sp.]|nr:hypothetical protein [Roseburia sp.]